MKDYVKDYVFETTCIHSTGKLISDMRDQEYGTVDYDEMMRHCEDMLEVALRLGYVRSHNHGHGLTLRNDWAVSYHKSFYDGVPCYYFVWSGIEHIWIKAE